MSKITSLISLLLIPLFISQNILTSFDYDKTLTYTLQDMQTMLNKNLYEQLQALPISNIEDTINLTNIKITAVSATLTSSYGNMQTQLYLFSPSKLSITFTLDYASTAATGSCEVQLSLFDFRTRFTVTDAKPAVKVTIETRAKDYVVFNVDVAEVATQIQTVMYNQMNQKGIITQIASEIEKGTNTFYEKLYENKDKYTFTSSTLLGSQSINITFDTFIAFPEDLGKEYKSAITSYSGNVEGKDVAVDKKEKALAKKEFVQPGDDYLTFINYDLFNDIFSSFITKGVVMTLNTNSIPSLSFTLTYKTMTTLFNGLPSSFAETDEVVISTQLSSIAFLAQGKGELTLVSSFNVKDTTNVMQLTTKVEFEAQATKRTTTSFDLCLNKVTVKSTEVNSAITISNQQQLNGYLNEIFNYGIKVPTCLTDKGITLRDYYRYIDNATSEEHGVYIQGKHIYF